MHKVTHKTSLRKQRNDRVENMAGTIRWNQVKQHFLQTDCMSQHVIQQIDFAIEEHYVFIILLLPDRDLFSSNYFPRSFPLHSMQQFRRDSQPIRWLTYFGIQQESRICFKFGTAKPPTGRHPLIGLPLCSKKKYNTASKDIKNPVMYPFSCCSGPIKGDNI